MSWVATVFDFHSLSAASHPFLLIVGNGGQHIHLQTRASLSSVQLVGDVLCLPASLQQVILLYRGGVVAVKTPVTTSRRNTITVDVLGLLHARAVLARQHAVSTTSIVGNEALERWDAQQ